MLRSPKYSLILPTLNGRRTLAVTLPDMLKIDRDDLEFVLSENHSDDDTWSLLKEIVADDDRVRLIRPPQRLPLGEHLEFAYRHATGRWLSHLGDDDHLLPWRFDLLDAVLDAAPPSLALMRGDYVRYSWPEYPEPHEANSLDPAQFSGRAEFKAGNQFARELLNRSHIHGGGAWVVRNDIAGQVRQRCGYFASPQHVEFFAMRAAAALSETVAVVGLPLFILGRHSKSSGTQYFLPKSTNRERSWDWSFEDPNAYHHIPFNWKSYSTLSCDAALAVRKALPEELGKTEVDWRTWLKTIHSELLRLVAFEQLPPAAIDDFLRGVAQLPRQSTWYWRWRTWRLRWQQWWRPPNASGSSSSNSSHDSPLGWSDRVLGCQHGFDKITDIPAWLTRRGGHAYRTCELQAIHS